MSDRYKLNETLSPIEPSSWRDLNENWDLIKSYLRFLERQIQVLAGGKEIADLIDSITSAIASVEKVISDSESAEEAVLEAIINLETTIENFAPKGTWSNAASYKKGNQVEVNGTTYIALVDNVNTPVTNTSTWRKFAERGLQGVQGPQGIQGPKGDKGDTGPQGIQGVQGPQGEIGPRGVQGAQGPKGDKGDKGEMGTGINILGEFTSSAQLPPSGNIGDAYLINGNIFVWAGSSWTDGGNIKGPKGDKGDKGDPGIQGVQGPQGLKGDTGSQGLKGADGKTWHVTASTPANSLGTIGDMHLNTATFDIREKTATSTWTVRGNIKGIKGDNGNDATVTSTNITNALGYTPANNSNLTALQQQVTTHLDDKVIDGVHGMGSAAAQNYEEGVWTPTLAGQTTEGSNSYTIREGKYIKIGKQVIATCNIQLSAKGSTMAGSVMIKGLPFATGDVTYAGASVNFSRNIDFPVGFQFLAGSVIGTSIFVHTGVGKTDIYLQSTAITNTTALSYTAIYRIA